MRPRSHLALPAWHKTLLWAAGAVLLLTGAAWLALHYGWGAGSGPDALPHPAEAWLMRCHGLGVFGGLFVSGLLAGGHVGQGWRVTARHRPARRGQRVSGVLLCSLLALLVVSGYALYYLVPDEGRVPLGWVHALLGAVMAMGVAWHGRGERRASRPAPRPRSRAPDPARD